MAKRRKRETEHTVSMDMTPMIDVVFQLLIFFLVTLKPIDVIGRLDVFRPQADPNARTDVPPDEMLRITVHENNRFMLNQRWMTLSALEQNLANAAVRSVKQTVLVQCSERSSHASLIAVLDLCAKVKLVNLSVVTLPPSAAGG